MLRRRTIYKPRQHNRLQRLSANTLMRAGPEQVDSPYHEAWVLNQIAMIQTALIGPAQQRYSDQPIEFKKKWQFFAENSKRFENQQSQTHAKSLLQRITRTSEEQIKTLTLRIEQTARKTYVNNAPDVRNAQMYGEQVKALDPKVARIASKKIASHKSTALEPHFLLVHLVRKISQEDITRTQIGRLKINTNTTPSASLNNISTDIVRLRYPNYGTGYRIWDQCSLIKIHKRSPF